MRARIYVVTLFIWLAITLAYGLKEVKAASDLEQPRIIERVITIEGTLEKPRVIFIVPRAKVWKEYIFKKSFIPDILRPVYPESLIEEQKD